MLLTRLTETHPLAIEAARIRAARVEAAQIAEQRRAARAAAGDDGGIIGKFNSLPSIADMLAECGYTRHRQSDDWRSPYQESGSHATHDYGGYWVSLSGSDAAAGLGIPTPNGWRTGDAFDLLCHFKHNGDEKATIQRGIVTVSLDMLKRNRQEMPGTTPMMPARTPTMPDTPDTPDTPAVTLRDFETLQFHARYVQADDVDSINEILIEANALPRLKQENILKALKAATGIGIGDLRVALKEARTGGDEEAPDHLTLARATLDTIGRENVLCTDSGVWRWQASGVWREQEDRERKSPQDVMSGRAACPSRTRRR